MGVSRLFVRFPDGVIRFGSYQDTADVPYSGLVDDLTDVAEVLKMIPPSDIHVGDVEVEIYCDYGGGFYWKGMALNNWLTDTGYSLDERFVGGHTDGAPEWVPAVWRWDSSQVP